MNPVLRTGDDTPFDPALVPISEAATVMLVRDAVDGRGPGVEVFMMRRTKNAVFGGGFYVFPGGRIDPADRDPEIATVCTGLDDVAASHRLSLDDGGLGYWVAAIRECFEEAGVLLAASPTGDVLRFDEPARTQRFAEYRHAIHDGTMSLATLCRAENLVLTLADVRYVSHWITPPGERRRFDTRFLVARAPDAQEPLHDDGETIASLWIRPADALDQMERREWMLMPPTERNLEFLAAFDTANGVMHAAATLPPPPAIRPRLRTDDEGRVHLVFADDPGYDALPA